MTFQQFVAGGVFGFSSILLPQLQLPGSLIRVDADQVSWIGKRRHYPGASDPDLIEPRLLGQGRAKVALSVG